MGYLMWLLRALLGLEARVRVFSRLGFGIDGISFQY